MHYWHLWQTLYLQLSATVKKYLLCQNITALPLLWFVRLQHYQVTIQFYWLKNKGRLIAQFSLLLSLRYQRFVADFHSV